MLTDLKMPGMDGIEFCSRLVASRPDVPVVVMTAFGNLETADRRDAGRGLRLRHQADRNGAVGADSPPRRRASAASSADPQPPRDGRSGPPRFEQLLGESPAMHGSTTSSPRSPIPKLRCSLPAKAARERSWSPGAPPAGAAAARTVRRRQLRGPARHAAGKRAVRPRQRGVHRRPRRPQGPVCRSRRGHAAFWTRSARCRWRCKPSCCELWRRTRCGPSAARRRSPSTSALLTATNRDLESAVEEQRFRQDLLFRINVIQLDVPPLRARGADVLLLAQHFIQAFAARAGKRIDGMAEPVAEKLLAYSWPGNVRELRNVVERAVALTRFDRLTIDDLPEKIRDYRSSQVVIASDDPGELLPLEEIERRVHSARAPVRRRQSHARRPHTRPRPQNALPQAAPIRRAGRRARAVGNALRGVPSCRSQRLGHLAPPWRNAARERRASNGHPR